MNSTTPGPGRLWTRVFGLLMPAGHRDAAVGDAEEEYALRRDRDGKAAADQWYRRQVVRSVGPALRRWLGALVERLKRREREGERMGIWLGDIRLALRILLKRPGFTGVVVFTLAAGIGATTALFAVFRGVFLEPLPLPESGEIVTVMQGGGFGCCGPASGPDYVDWVERQRTFDELGLLYPGSLILTGLEDPERVYGVRVTPNTFDLLGVEPALGRTFTPDDQAAGDVVMLGHPIWTRVYGGRRDILGETLDVNGEAKVIIGVMPESFDVPSPWLRNGRHEIYLPMPLAIFERSRGSHAFPVIGRLSDGSTIESAQADMDRIMAELAQEYPETNGQREAYVFTLHEYLYGDIGDQLLLILAAAGLVLLIACANVGGLQLARAAGREAELSVRAALGASRSAVARLLFTESFLLAAVGGALGIGVAYASLAGLRAVLPPSMPRVDGVEIDPVALAFALGASVFTAIAFGMLPAMLASRTDLASGVREGGSGTLAPSKERARNAFIVAQIALGLVLANGAGLLVRSYAEVMGQDYGFRTEGVVAMSLNAQGPAYESWDAREQYVEAVFESARQVGGVGSVGLVSRLPLSGGSNGSVQVEGWEPRSSLDQGPLVEVTSVAGDYFATMGIPLVRGRLLVPDDSIPDAVGVVINEAMADEVWADEDPLGKRFGFGTPPPWLTVVGVVGNVRQWGPERAPLAQVYFPLRRGWNSMGYLTVAYSGDAGTIVPELRRAVLAVDPAQPPSDIRTMGERLDADLAQRRFYTTLIGLFAIAALFLASAGVYGTVSYFVARRTREMGIRMALGAGGSGVVGMVVARGARLAVWGIVLGLVGVWATTSIAESMVYGVAALDPLSLLVGCVVLAGVAVLASALPAMRAQRIHPSVALRTE